MNYFLTLFLCLLSTVALAQPSTSLFFHPEETAEINEAVQDLPPQKKTAAKHLLHVDSILFINAKHWTVWMQGKKITPQSQQAQHQTHRVFGVTPTSLNITAKLHNGHLITKSLSLHQSLNLLTGEVVEGG